MDVIEKELQSRRTEIETSIRLLFKANMKITDWDIPEADDKEAAKMIADIFQEVLDEIKDEIQAGKYDYY